MICPARKSIDGRVARIEIKRHGRVEQWSATEPGTLVLEAVDINLEDHYVRHEQQSVSFVRVSAEWHRVYEQGPIKTLPVPEDEQIFLDELDFEFQPLLHTIRLNDDSSGELLK